MTQPNILFVVLDATRFDACSCYGHVAGTTPVLDRLAAEGVLFEQAISAAPWTLPAVTSMMTGLYPSQTDIYRRRRLLPGFTTLPTLLRQHGYATFGVTNNDWLSQDFGLQQGFDVVHKLWQIWQTDDDITNLSLVEQDKTIDPSSPASAGPGVAGQLC